MMIAESRKDDRKQMSKGATSKGQLQPDQNEKPNLTLLMLLTAIVPDKQSKKNAPPVMQDELDTEAKRFTVRQVEGVQRRDISCLVGGISRVRWK